MVTVFPFISIDLGFEGILASFFILTVNSYILFFLGLVPMILLKLTKAELIFPSSFLKVSKLDMMGGMVFCIVFWKSLDTFRSLCPVDVYVVPDVVIHVIGFGYCLLNKE